MVGQTDVEEERAETRTGEEASEAQDKPAEPGGAGDADTLQDAIETRRWFDSAYLHRRQMLLLSLLRSAVKVLEADKVQYWITGGTLLGAIRHGGFIPHDDDIDLECFTADYDQIKALFKVEPAMTVEKAGKYRDGTQICRIFPVPYPDEMSGRGSCGIDIFLRSSGLPEEPEFPSAAEVFPLQRYEFHGVQVYGPSQPASFLSRCYAADWATKVHVWNHQFNFWTDKRHNPDRVILSVEEYNSLVASLGYMPPSLEGVGPGSLALDACGTPMDSPKGCHDLG